jgi:integrase
MPVFKEICAVTGSPVHSSTSIYPAGSIASATNGQRRKGKSMSRRSGQAGAVVRVGKFYRVRFRIDVPNGRIHRSVTLCPADPKAIGYLNKVERQRRAAQIAEQAGANSAELFDRAVAVESGTTFRQQAERWLYESEHRKRNPVASSTLESWRSALNRWLLPALGDVPLADVNNPALKTLVASLDEAKLSAKSITNYVQIVKMVVASAINEDGDPMYPRKWNHQFIDLPVVDRKKQRTPCFAAETVTALVATATKKWERMLCILCAASGLRIGEALGIDIAHISPDRSTIQIRQKVRKCRVEDSLKTKNAEREIDLHSSVAALLKDFIGDREGLLFPTRSGKPMSDSNFRNRFLYVRLRVLGKPKAGAHAFRRFRNTYLRNKTTCPDGLLKFWMGHSVRDMSDLYDKIRQDVQYRKDVAESVGIGFELPKEPDVVPSVPRFAAQNAVEVSA